MRLFKYFLVFTLLIFGKNSFANYFQAGGYVQAGAGAYGGAQACPYPSGGGGGGGGLEGKLNAYDNKIADLEDQIADLEYEQEDAADGIMGRRTEVSFKANVGKGLMKLAVDYHDGKYVNCDTGDGLTDSTTALKDVLAGAGASLAGPTGYCESKGGINVYNPDRICDNAAIYKSNDDLDDNKKDCHRLLDQYLRLEKRKCALIVDIDRLKEKADRIEDKIDRAEDRALDRGESYSGGSEGYCMTGLCGNHPEPTAPGWGQIATAGIFDALSLWGARDASKRDARLGWPSRQPWWLGAGSNSMALWAGSGAMYGGACGPQNGYALGPNGMYGNPNGNISPYGGCGGAIMSACGPGGQYGGGGPMGPLGVGGYAGYGGPGGYGGGGPGGLGFYPGGGVNGYLGVGGNGGYGGPGGYGYPGGPGGYPGGPGGYAGGYLGIGGPGGYTGYPGGPGGYPGGPGGYPYPGGPGGYPGGPGGYPGGPGGYPGYGYGNPYAEAQARAFMNQQVIGSQISGLQYQRYEIEVRLNQLIQQYYGMGGGGGVGFGFGGSINIGGSIGVGGYPGGGPVPIGGVIPPGSGPVPPR